MSTPPFRRLIAGSFRRRAMFLAWLLTACLAVPLLSACGPSHEADAVIIAATATANEPEPVLSPDVLTLLQTAGTASTDATAYVVAPGSGEPTDFALTPRRPDGQVDFGPTRAQVLAANVTAVQRAVEAEAADGPFDLLNTMAQAARVAPAPATIILVSSGLSVSGGLDMRQVGWDVSPQSVATQLKARGLLPKLTGYHLVFSGLADTAGDQPALPLPQRTELISLWMSICRASGAASCAVDEMTRADPPSRSTTSVPVVPVPAVRSVRGPSGTTVTTVPDDLLFAFNSASLVAAADSVLQPVADQGRADHLYVSITGYASPDGGSPGYNRALSQRRALAVRNRLITLGLPASQIVTVAGDGTAGLTRAVCIVNGQLNEATCGQYRRVVIVMSPNASQEPTEENQ